MVFSSLAFICVYLPVVLALYYFCNPKYRNVVLLVSSLLFYAWGEPKFLYVMVTSIVGNYLCGLLIHSAGENKRRRKAYLAVSVVFNVGLLFIFKYLNFSVSVIESVFSLNSPYKSIALPIGISFFTFQGLSYVIDLYRGEVKVQKNFLNLALYKALFPQLIAGPIVRYIHVEKQLTDRTVTLESFSGGIQRFIVGLSKKVLIANIVGDIADKIFNSNYGQMSTATAWVGLVCYTLQIFFDFSGYSDMAIGLGKLFGFDFHENFDYPYISKSVTEFWRRWHISLSSWFRDYLYIPLGGNRKGSARTLVNLLIVFATTGIWHGAAWNFLIWGLWHGMFMILERLFRNNKSIKIPPALQWTYTMLVVMIGWVLFRADGIGHAIDYLQVLFYLGGQGFTRFSAWYYLDGRVVFTIAVGVLAVLPWKNILQSFKMNTDRLAHLTDVPRKVAVLLLLILDMIYITTSSFNPFIYFRF